MNIKKQKKKLNFKYRHKIKDAIYNLSKYKKYNRFFKNCYKADYNEKNELYLNKIKSGDLNFFFRLPKDIKKSNELVIPIYEDNINQLLGCLNIGFFGFIFYLFLLIFLASN